MTRFSGGLNFLERFETMWDIVRMDIEMPGSNGMDTVRRSRGIKGNIWRVDLST